MVCPCDLSDRMVSPCGTFTARSVQQRQVNVDATIVKELNRPGFTGDL
jgi:hypothetical protein